MFIQFQIALVLEAMFQKYGRMVFAEAMRADDIAIVILANNGDTPDDITVH